MNVVQYLFMIANLYGAQAIKQDSICINQLSVVQQYDDTCSYHAIRNTDIILSGDTSRLANHKEADEFVLFCDNWLPVLNSINQVRHYLFEYLTTQIGVIDDALLNERFRYLLSQVYSSILSSQEYDVVDGTILYSISREDLYAKYIELLNRSINDGSSHPVTKRNRKMAKSLLSLDAFNNYFHSSEILLSIDSNGCIQINGQRRGCIKRGPLVRGDTNDFEGLVTLLKKTGRITHEITLYTYDEPYIAPGQDLEGLAPEQYRWRELKDTMVVGNDHTRQMVENISLGKDFRDGFIVLVPRISSNQQVESEKAIHQGLINERNDSHWYALVVEQGSGKKTYTIADSLGIDRRNDKNTLELIALLEGRNYDYAKTLERPELKAQFFAIPNYSSGLTLTKALIAGVILGTCMYGMYSKKGSSEVVDEIIAQSSSLDEAVLRLKPIFARDPAIASVIFEKLCSRYDREQVVKELQEEQVI